MLQERLVAFRDGMGACSWTGAGCAYQKLDLVEFWGWRRAQEDAGEVRGSVERNALVLPFDIAEAVVGCFGARRVG
jgi:hypothetical protein